MNFSLVPAQTMDVKFHTTPSNLNVSCEATGLFPRPKLKLYRIIPKERTPSIVKDVFTSTLNSRDTYNTSLYKSFEHEELSARNFGVRVRRRNSGNKLPEKEKSSLLCRYVTSKYIYSYLDDDSKRNELQFCNGFSHH
ncbi:hypothetical protein CEXT_534711 [Caerostris extrusa]|uniref:Uncharacterized protein n=1 Tax=Caerostris extrusa TaxID=172846 RepID=A0AAV4WQY7_CAEEX|nr:hypothetical protein CEXT_534711 [Caerostris extrusa]